LSGRFEPGQSADPEQAFRFLNRPWVAAELQGNPAVFLFQNDSKETEVMPFETTAKVFFGLPHDFAFEESRPKIGFDGNHGEDE
jgi:hypothetical protein